MSAATAWELELIWLDLVSVDEMVLSRWDWPASWEQLDSFTAMGGYFRTIISLPIAMDIARQQAQLDSVLLDVSINWGLLQLCHEALRRQEHPQPDAHWQGKYKLFGELFMEAAPL